MPDYYASPGKPLVVKYGGNALPEAGEPDPVLAEIAAFAKAGRPAVVVHGGGPEIDAWLSERKIVTQRINGLRVTDAQTLEITEAVLCGTLNKRLVRGLNALGARAVGISGQDGPTFTATASNPELGLVGTDVTANPELVLALLAAGYVPVVAPLAVDASSSTALNVNADTAAAVLAGALQAHAFVMLTNVKRVLRDPRDARSAIDRICVEDARRFAKSEACSGGMKPKIAAAITAAISGARATHICAAGPDAIASALRGDATIVTVNGT